MVAVVLPTPTLPPRPTGPVRAPSSRRPGSVAPGRHLRRGSVTARTSGSDRSLPAAGRLRRPWSVLALVLVGLVALVVLALLPAVDLSTPRSAGTHVVADGETMWSIATEMAPAGDAPRYAERLVELNGTSTVAAGQVLELPAR